MAGGDHESDPWRAVIRAYDEIERTWAVVTRTGQGADVSVVEHRRTLAAWKEARCAWQTAFRVWRREQDPW
jgi:hypothetical protein